MTDMRDATVYYASRLSEDKLKSAFDFVKYLYEQDAPPLKLFKAPKIEPVYVEGFRMPSREETHER